MNGSPLSLKCLPLVFEETEEPGVDRGSPGVVTSPLRAHAHSHTHTDTHLYTCTHRDTQHTLIAFTQTQTHPLPSLDHSTWSSVSSTSSKPSGQISCPLGPGPNPRLEP